MSTTLEDIVVPSEGETRSRRVRAQEGGPRIVTWPSRSSASSFEEMFRVLLEVKRRSLSTRTLPVSDRTANQGRQFLDIKRIGRNGRQQIQDLCHCHRDGQDFASFRTGFMKKPKGGQQISSKRRAKGASPNLNACPSIFMKSNGYATAAKSL